MEEQELACDFLGAFVDAGFTTVTTGFSSVALVAASWTVKEHHSSCTGTNKHEERKTKHAHHTHHTHHCIHNNNISREHE